MRKGEKHSQQSSSINGSHEGPFHGSIDVRESAIDHDLLVQESFDEYNSLAEEELLRKPRRATLHDASSLDSLKQTKTKQGSRYLTA